PLDPSSLPFLSTTPHPPTPSPFPYPTLSRSQFVENVSRQLRDPLQAIQGYAKMRSARLFGPLNDRQSEHVDSIVAAAGELDELRSEEHTSELQSLTNLVCRLLLEKKKEQRTN